MQLTSFLATTLALGAMAAPTWDFPSGGGNGVPGYPFGFPGCLSDQQAAFVVKQYKSILTNPDRKAAATTAQTLVDNNYVETSDSINVLAGYPEGGASFNGKQAFIDGVANAPAIPSMTDLDTFHNCNKILWEWRVDGLGRNVSPVKGINKIVVDPNTGVIKSVDLEFNSIAWGRDIGWTCTAPGQ